MSSRGVSASAPQDGPPIKPRPARLGWLLLPDGTRAVRNLARQAAPRQEQATLSKQGLSFQRLRLDLEEILGSRSDIPGQTRRLAADDQLNLLNMRTVGWRSQGQLSACWIASGSR